MSSKLVVGTVVAGLLSAPAAFAASREYAEVVSSRPLYREVRVAEPRQECWEEPVAQRQDYWLNNGRTGAIVGAIAGGVAGHQFGKGRGRDVATIGGAILGGLIGQRVARTHYPEQQYGQGGYQAQCRTVNAYRTEQRIDGYDVAYRYGGQVYHTRTAQAPGRTIPVNVQVSPSGEYGYTPAQGYGNDQGYGYDQRGYDSRGYSRDQRVVYRGYSRSFAAVIRILAVLAVVCGSFAPAYAAAGDLEKTSKTPALAHGAAAGIEVAERRDADRKQQSDRGERRGKSERRDGDWLGEPLRPQSVERRMSPDQAAGAARAQNGGGRVLQVLPTGDGYRVKLLKDGEVRVVEVPANERKQLPKFKIPVLIAAPTRDATIPAPRAGPLHAAHLAMRALVIEDDNDLREQVVRYFTEDGFAVDAAAEGEQGLYIALEYPADVAVVDLGLPHTSGIDIIRAARKAGRNYPILILTARDGWQNKVAGLEAGADDYLVKPFHKEELLARVRALLRRSGGWSHAQLQSGPVVLDTTAKNVSLDGQAVDLTAYEYRVLEYLLLHAGEVVSKTALTDHLYAEDEERDSNVIEVFIRRLRTKLDPAETLKPIETLRGRGYRWTLPRPAANEAKA